MPSRLSDADLEIIAKVLSAYRHNAKFRALHERVERIVSERMRHKADVQRPSCAVRVDDAKQGCAAMRR